MIPPPTLRFCNILIIPPPLIGSQLVVYFLSSSLHSLLATTDFPPLSPEYFCCDGKDAYACMVNKSVIFTPAIYMEWRFFQENIKLGD